MVDPLPVTCPLCGGGDWKTVAGLSSFGITGLAAIGPASSRYEHVIRCHQCGTEWNKPGAGTLQRQGEVAFERRLEEFAQRQAALNAAAGTSKAVVDVTVVEPAADATSKGPDLGRVDNERVDNDQVADASTYVRIERPYGGLRGMFGRFTIYIDGQRRRRLAPGKACLLAVEPGLHRLRAEFGFGTWRSAELRIDVLRGHTAHVELESWGSLLPTSNEDLDTTRPWFRLRLVSTAPSTPAS